MKTIWIKLVVALALVLLVVGGIIFWPTETGPKDAPVDLKPPPRVQQTRAEGLYQMALSRPERDNPSEMDFRIMADCCRKILADYPDSPEAEKATELLQEVPERYQRLSVAQVPSKPAVRKSKPLRRRPPR
ncbi:MAG: hypothetical protein GWO10_03720 [candidate division Zixibacteria bacterium]|nr:hypothetical protein [Phycisphaerae bacterium]NIR62901.1 hypothetical protein [candidate division Zixibacteria bacterium]NIW97093.1 hypothetical protein [Phycisphaerae bacterium]